MPIDFEPIDDQSSISFEPIETPKVKKKSAADIVIEKPVARERLTMGGEFTGGLSDFFGDMFGGNIDKDAGVVEAGLHRLRAPLGLMRAASAPLAPVTNLITEAGEGVSGMMQKLGFQTGADIAGGLTTVAGDILSGGGISKLMGKVKPALATRLPTKAEKITKLKTGSADDIAKVTAQADKDVASSAALQNTELKEFRKDVTANQSELDELTRSIKSTADENAMLESGREAAEESFKSIAEAARKQAADVPDVAKIKATLAKDAPLGNVAGQTFKESYNRGLSLTKARFNEQYDTLLKNTENMPVDTTGYLARTEKILGEKGVSRPLPTRAESVAQKAQRTMDIEDDRFTELVEKHMAAKRQGFDTESILKDELDKHIASMGQGATVKDLILERQRLRSAERAAFQVKNDNLHRQFKELREGIEADIPKDVFRSLKAVDEAYFKEYVPYYSKRSVTRSIAEGSADSVVDSIVRPATDKKAVEKITRAYELMDGGDKEAVSKAFMNKTIERAFKDGEFDPKKFSAAWDRYADTAGNNNQVLKTVLGDRYKDAEAIMNTLRTAKPQNLDAVARKAIEGITAFTASQVKKVDPASLARKGTLEKVLADAPGVQNKFIQDTGKEIAGIRTSTEAQVQALKTKLEKEIEGITGKKIENVGSGFIGSLFMTEGAIKAATGDLAGGGFKILAGGLIMISRGATVKLLNTKRGLSVFRSLTRSAPGSVQAMAAARIAGNILKGTTEDE